MVHGPHLHLVQHINMWSSAKRSFSVAGGDARALAAQQQAPPIVPIMKPIAEEELPPTTLSPDRAALASRPPSAPIRFQSFLTAFSEECRSELEALASGTKRQEQDEDKEDDEPQDSIERTFNPKRASLAANRRRSTVGSIKSQESGSSGERLRLNSLGFGALAVIKMQSKKWKAKASKDSKDPNIKHGPVYENTFRLEPCEGETFRPGRAELCMTQLMEKLLTNKTYDARKCPIMCKMLSKGIKDALKPLYSPRYKYVASVTIAQRLGQELHHGSRCLWQVQYDDSATAVFQNAHLTAVATAFAIYHN